jgi:hypothetical protein
MQNTDFKKQFKDGIKEDLYADFLASKEFKELNTEYSVHTLIKKVIDFVLEKAVWTDKSRL